MLTVSPSPTPSFKTTFSAQETDVLFFVTPARRLSRLSFVGSGHFEGASEELRHRQYCLWAPTGHPPPSSFFSALITIQRAWEEPTGLYFYSCSQVHSHLSLLVQKPLALDSLIHWNREGEWIGRTQVGIRHLCTDMIFPSFSHSLGPSLQPPPIICLVIFYQYSWFCLKTKKGCVNNKTQIALLWGEGMHNKVFSGWGESWCSYSSPVTRGTCLQAGCLGSGLERETPTGPHWKSPSMVLLACALNQRIKRP